MKTLITVRNSIDEECYIYKENILCLVFPSLISSKPGTLPALFYQGLLNPIIVRNEEAVRILKIMKFGDSEEEGDKKIANH